MIFQWSAYDMTGCFFLSGFTPSIKAFCQRIIFILMRAMTFHLVISHIYALIFNPHYGKSLDTPLKLDLSYT